MGKKPDNDNTSGDGPDLTSRVGSLEEGEANLLERVKVLEATNEKLEKEVQANWDQGAASLIVTVEEMAKQIKKLEKGPKVRGYRDLNDQENPFSGLIRGRIVHYNDHQLKNQPLAAIVTDVNGDNHLDLAYFEPDGSMHIATDVPYSRDIKPHTWAWPRA